tara:strand:- start:122 stop:904 length:783 start_codon:yes stop_codon:yes gene_type:complete
MDYILSEKNKGFLWQLLYNKQIFKGIPNNKVENIKEIFENIIQNVASNTKNTEIIEINKEIIKNLNTEIGNFKQKLLEGKNIKDEFRDSKTKFFDKDLESHKNSLDKLINPGKPKEIDFKDESDKPIDNNEMNKILEQMQKERNIEVASTENKISDKNLINLDNNMDSSSSENVPKIKIESIEELLETDIIDLNEEQAINKPINKLKKESFKIKDVQSLLEDEYVKENKINSNMKLDNIYKLLNKVLENQEKIMNKLELI